MYTVLYDEQNVPEERGGAQGRKKKMKRFPQRKLLLRVDWSCPCYLKTQLLNNQILTNIPDMCIPVLFSKWSNSEMKFV